LEIFDETDFGNLDEKQISCVFVLFNDDLSKTIGPPPKSNNAYFCTRGKQLLLTSFDGGSYECMRGLQQFPSTCSADHVPVKLGSSMIILLASLVFLLVSTICGQIEQIANSKTIYQ